MEACAEAEAESRARAALANTLSGEHAIADREALATALSWPSHPEREVERERTHRERSRERREGIGREHRPSELVSVPSARHTPGELQGGAFEGRAAS